MVLVPMGEQNSPNLVPDLYKVSGVGKNQVNPRKVFPREREPTVYQERFTVVADKSEVLADLSCAT